MWVLYFFQFAVMDSISYYGRRNKRQRYIPELLPENTNISDVGSSSGEEDVEYIQTDRDTESALFDLLGFGSHQSRKSH